MSNRKNTGSFSGKGYYIALILCAAAIGISGYLYYRNANEPEPQLQQPTGDVGAMDPTGGDVQVIGTKPVGEKPTQGKEPVATEPAKKPAMKTGRPISGEVIAEYAMDCLTYNETTRDWRVHNGIDIGAEAGTPVLAAADGTVYTVFEDDSMGTTVVLRHENGYVTTYASLDEKVSVAVGDTVKLGQTIGTVGNTALLETAIGDHLHFSVACNDKIVDPAEFFAMN